jgi:hypothetical protein
MTPNYSFKVGDMVKIQSTKVSRVLPTGLTAQDTDGVALPLCFHDSSLGGFVTILDSLRSTKDTNGEDMDDVEIWSLPTTRAPRFFLLFPQNVPVYGLVVETSDLFSFLMVGIPEQDRTQFEFVRVENHADYLFPLIPTE